MLFYLFSAFFILFFHTVLYLELRKKEEKINQEQPDLSIFSLQDDHNYSKSKYTGQRKMVIKVKISQ